MQKYSKFIAAFMAFVGVVLASGLLTGPAQAWASTIVTGVGAGLVFLIPNTRPVPAEEPYDPEVT